MLKPQGLLNLSPLRITTAYVVFGVVWILVSDWLVASIAHTPSVLTTLQTLKGWMFVTVSGLLIFVLTNLHHQRLTDSRERLENTHQQLQVLHRVLRHNIRNNLNIIRGYLDLTLDGASDEQVHQFVDTANDSVDQILNLSEKFSLVNEVDLQPDEESYVDLIEVIHRARQRVQAEYPAVTIEQSLPERARVLGDSTLVHVVYELFVNAIEHNDGPPETRQVHVSVEKSGSKVTMTVRDNGPGIPDGELEAILQGEETPLVHSSGMGLWLVHWLCQFHGGTVEFNTSSEGTDVILSFDVAPRPILAGRFE